jgi:hypothetical protein
VLGEVETRGIFRRKQAHQQTNKQTKSGLNDPNPKA